MPSFEPAPLSRARPADFVADPFGPGRATPGPVPGDAPEVDPARLEAEARESGHARGREEGYAEGRAAGRAEVTAEVLGSAAGALEEAAAGLLALRRGALQAQRRAVVELALALAEKLVGRAVADDPEVLAGVVERAVDALAEPEPVAVRLSTVDWKTLESGGAPRLDRLRTERGLEVVADSGLAPGDVRVQGQATQVDARLDELLRRARAELAELFDLEGGPR